MNSNSIIKPHRLPKGGTIGIASPAKWMAEDRLKIAAKVLIDAGYRVKFGSACHLRENQYAGSTEQRIRELEDLFADPEIDAIICARGGYGSIRVTDKLDYLIIRENPKIFVGFSDITALHCSFQQECGLTTFHGPMLWNFEESTDPFTLSNLLYVMSGDDPAELEFPKNLPPIVLREGTVSAPLFGGNLTLLTKMIGTRWDFDTEGTILFVEDIDEKYYRTDRDLLHLKRAGKLDGIAALVVGQMTNIEDEEIPFGKSVDEIVMDICGDGDYPIVSNFPCGHGRHLATLPLGIPTRLAAVDSNVSFKLLELAVS
ncbi:MAG TPA: LD-carboxypeptidase [Candidatus Marinimicrobia bacterium]|nr:LD-carboxypeptidase [Candidatus Neomarinimicrobiota bacterium]